MPDMWPWPNKKMKGINALGGQCLACGHDQSKKNGRHQVQILKNTVQALKHP